MIYSALISFSANQWSRSIKHDHWLAENVRIAQIVHPFRERDMFVIDDGFIVLVSFICLPLKRSRRISQHSEINRISSSVSRYLPLLGPFRSLPFVQRQDEKYERPILSRWLDTYYVDSASVEECSFLMSHTLVRSSMDDILKRTTLRE